MNQQCKVCGEPAAGFHFGAFTCEGCKSFFGRSYNNAASIQECKNGGNCVINKKNRTTCKACRLRKCIFVGMSKSGSRYGRRSNWFKIHCLLQEQNQQMQMPLQGGQAPLSQQGQSSLPAGQKMGLQEMDSNELEDMKNSTPPLVSSPESRNSDSSVEVTERRSFSQVYPRELPNVVSWARDMIAGPNRMPFFVPHPALMPASGLTVLSPYNFYPHPLIANIAATANRFDVGATYAANNEEIESRSREPSINDPVTNDNNFDTNKELQKIKLEKASRYVLEENWKKENLNTIETSITRTKHDDPPQDKPIDLSFKRQRCDEEHFEIDEEETKVEENVDEMQLFKKIRSDPIDLSYKF